MTRKRTVIFAAVVLALLAGLFLLGRSVGWWAAPASPTDTPPPRLTLFISADTLGHLEPCGCASGQWGGLPRRATVLAGRTDQPRLAVDMGNMTAGRRPWELIGFRYVLDALGQMGYAAANLGETELTIPAADWPAIIERSPVPLISANTFDTATGQPIVEPYHVVTIDGCRVAIVGVTDPPAVSPLGDGLRVEQPEVVLASLLPRLASQVELIVLVAHVDEQRLAELVGANPEIDLAVAGRVQQASPDGQRVNAVPVAWLANHGKTLGSLSVEFRAGRVAAARFAAENLVDTLPDHPQVKQLVEQFNVELGEHSGNADSSQQLLGLPRYPRNASLNSYVPPEQCRQCHQAAYDKWKSVRHSSALVTLSKKNRQFIPGCLECHTVGFGASDGYLGLEQSATHGFVGCDNCHGRGKNHVLEMNGRPFTGSAALLRPTRQTCVTCHDGENSPNFDFDEYRAKIVHKLDPVTPRYDGKAPTTRPAHSASQP